jgi:CheY-like chemotaxis protein
MPVMTGFEAIQEIRRIPELQHVIIVAVTASVFDIEHDQNKLAGCDAFLPKPIKTGQFFTLLEKLMKVEWMYAAPGPEDTEETSLAAAESVEFPLIAPPMKELEALFELAMMGNLSGIQEHAATLEQLNVKFQPFARKLSQLAADYQDEELLAFVKEHIGEGL